MDHLGALNGNRREEPPYADPICFRVYGFGLQGQCAAILFAIPEKRAAIIDCARNVFTQSHKTPIKPQEAALWRST